MTFPRTQGEANARAKVDDDKVRAIRRLHKEGVPTAALCERYGLTRQAVNRIIKRLTWAHVQDEPGGEP